MPHTALTATPKSSRPPALSAFRAVPRTGVIYVTSEAEKRGFRFHHPDWCNLGQGQPETGEIPGAPERCLSIPIHAEDQDYAPVAGIWELREAVAHFYNQHYRQGKSSLYTAENVAICGGGRVALIRACAAIAPVHVGHFLPDYTAYEELLDVFRRFQPIPILLDPAKGYAFDAEALREEVLGRGLGAVLLSNPCNPTGSVIHGDALRDWVAVARQLECALLVDEFYSHYVWMPGRKRVSVAEYVEDVNQDPVVFFDGLTKNWRYPGWRVSWVVGPKSVIRACASAGSFLDGGGSRPMQRAAISLLEPSYADREADALQACFRPKRDLMVGALRRMGFHIEREPEGTFYVWASLKNLPAPLNTGMGFFNAALDAKVITVPGEFFDINPGKRRVQRPSRFEHHVRFSFGPELPVIEEALRRIEALVAKARR